MNQNLNLLSDEQLILEMQNKKLNPGSNEMEKYMNIFHQRYFKYTINYCRKFKMKYSDAEDIAQEVFLKFFKFYQSFKNGYIFKYWFFKIVKNELFGQYKMNQKNKNVSIDSDNITLIYPESKIESMIEQSPLYQAIGILPDKMQEVIELRYYQDRNLNDIAKSINISSRQVRNRLIQAKSIIRKEFKKQISSPMNKKYSKNQNIA